ncbi:hypothetical protein [Paenibacillus albidus]|uniref:hypothetical protein n=1 Tax=Paenibacillus albidus TaxID=2041023 RepID=UPI001BEB2030|nr:hypothetical protein [Paenibacillus albidus]
MLVIEAVRDKGYKNVKGILKVKEGVFQTTATKNLGKRVYYGLIVRIEAEGITIGVDSAYS